MKHFFRRGRLAGKAAAAVTAAVFIAVFAFAGAPVLARDDGAAAPGSGPEITSTAAVLMDVVTGKVLFSHNPDERILPASLAKTMTMILALEALESGAVTPDTPVLISEEVWRLALQGRPGGASAMFLEVGETVPFRELLYGVGVLSGNDSALAVAEHLSGSEQAFVQKMNSRAAELGLTDTVFANSHGLPAENQHTTARDMARLAREFVKNHHHGLIYMSAKEYTYADITQPNRNRLLFIDDRVTGLKTGFLAASGYHLVATAESGPMSLAAAVLGAEDETVREREALALLNYGFQQYTTISPAWTGGDYEYIPVYKGAEDEVRAGLAEPITVTVPRAGADALEVELDVPEYLSAPVAEGETVGTVTVKAGGQVEKTANVLAMETVPRGGFFKVIWDSIRLFFKSLIQR